MSYITLNFSVISQHINCYVKFSYYCVFFCIEVVDIKDWKNFATSPCDLSLNDLAHAQVSSYISRTCSNASYWGFLAKHNFFYKKIVIGNQKVNPFNRLQTLYYKRHSWGAASLVCSPNFKVIFFNGIFSRLSCFFESWRI